MSSGSEPIEKDPAALQRALGNHGSDVLSGRTDILWGRKGYRFVNCEKVDYRSERRRGAGLKPPP